MESKDMFEAKEQKKKLTPNEGNLTPVMKVPIGNLRPNPYQPRKKFRESQLVELSKSLKVDGIIQPIIVSKDDSPGLYIIVAGERRWRASQLAGFTHVPVILKETTTRDLLTLALIENIQRADLNVIEEAEAYNQLIDQFKLNHDECAKRVGKDRTTVTNTLRLLTLPRQIQDDLVEGLLTMGHGRALLSIKEKRNQLRARDIIVQKKLSVRQSEQLVKKFKAGKATKTGSSTDEANLGYLAENLRAALRTKVKFTGSGARGRIEISYFSAAELERLLEMFRSLES